MVENSGDSNQSKSIFKLDIPVVVMGGEINLISAPSSAVYELNLTNCVPSDGVTVGFVLVATNVSPVPISPGSATISDDQQLGIVAALNPCVYGIVTFEHKLILPDNSVLL